MASNEHDQLYSIYQDIQTLMDFHDQMGRIINEAESSPENLSQIELYSSAVLEVCDKIEEKFWQEKRSLLLSNKLGICVYIE